MANETVTYDMLEGSAKEWANGQEISIRRETAKLLILIVASVASPFFVYLLRPESQEAAQWFQRSGAIMVVLALLAELRVVTIDRLIVARDHSFLYCHMYIEQKYRTKLTFVNYASYLVVAIGTAIWGFGDLLYEGMRIGQ